MSYHIYNEKISQNYIKVFVDLNNIMWIHDYYVDPHKAKLFAVMLKKACDEMIARYGCKKHVQYVKFSDWQTLKSDSKWKLEYEDENAQVCMISCDILNAPVCICDGFL
jgi:hypothetical protein